MILLVFNYIIQFILLYVTLLILFIFMIKSMSSLFEYSNIVLFETAFDFLCVEIVS